MLTRYNPFQPGAFYNAEPVNPLKFKNIVQFGMLEYKRLSKFTEKSFTTTTAATAMPPKPPQSSIRQFFASQGGAAGASRSSIECEVVDRSANSSSDVLGDVDESAPAPAPVSCAEPKKVSLDARHALSPVFNCSSC